jgi:hypothetical protein
VAQIPNFPMAPIAPQSGMSPQAWALSPQGRAWAQSPQAQAFERYQRQPYAASGTGNSMRDPLAVPNIANIIQALRTPSLLGITTF